MFCRSGTCRPSLRGRPWGKGVFCGMVCGCGMLRRFRTPWDRNHAYGNSVESAGIRNLPFPEYGFGLPFKDDAGVMVEDERRCRSMVENVRTWLWETVGCVFTRRYPQGAGEPGKAMLWRIRCRGGPGEVSAEAVALSDGTEKAGVPAEHRPFLAGKCFQSAVFSETLSAAALAASAASGSRRLPLRRRM